MEKYNFLLKGIELKQELTFLNLRLEPAPEGVMVSAQSPMEQKQFQRQLSILKGRLALVQAELPPQNPIGPEDLPDGEKPEDLLAVWYERASRAETLHSRLVASYNAFGALPGGFPAVEKNMEQWLGRPLGEKLMTYVNLVRQEDDELDGLILELPSWSTEELEAVNRGILAAAKGGFSK